MKRGPITSVVLAPIRLYRRYISPALPPRCKYYPSCSRYAEEAITELGVVRGSILAAWRILRCNPLSWGGVDELGDRRLFRGAVARSERAGIRAGHAHHAHHAHHGHHGTAST